MNNLSFDFFQGVGLGYVEFGYGGAAQRFQVGSGALKLAHFVGYGTHVGSRGHAGAEPGAVALDCQDDEFFDLDLHRLQDYLFLFSGQFVGRDAVDFLGRERWRDLLDQALKSGGQFVELLQAGISGLRFAESFAIGIVGVGGEAEADHALVGFFGCGVELRQAG